MPLDSTSSEAPRRAFFYLALIGFFGIASTTLSKNPVLSLYVHALSGNEALLGLIAAVSPLAGILFLRSPLLVAIAGADLATYFAFWVLEAPALTHADIGIAMGITGTEVTK